MGHSNLEISQQLFISESTVKSHVSSLLQKLKAKRRTQAVQNAKELQIIWLHEKLTFTFYVALSLPLIKSYLYNPPDVDDR